jgi:hypothetical protein
MLSHVLKDRGEGHEKALYLSRFIRTVCKIIADRAATLADGNALLPAFHG